MPYRDNFKCVRKLCIFCRCWISQFYFSWVKVSFLTIKSSIICALQFTVRLKILTLLCSPLNLLFPFTNLFIYAVGFHLKGMICLLTLDFPLICEDCKLMICRTFCVLLHSYLTKALHYFFYSNFRKLLRLFMSSNY